MHTIHNSRVQLLATAFNNLALALIIAGVVAPAVNDQLDGVGRVVVALTWAVGIILHIDGPIVLGRQRR
jgi:hypothetical protein